MDDILQLTLLYDFYGELLTEKQKQVYELHYQNDLSLTEIGEELSISRRFLLLAWQPLHLPPSARLYFSAA